jgi:hypothetical protein
MDSQGCRDVEPSYEEEGKGIPGDETSTAGLTNSEGYLVIYCM